MTRKAVIAVSASIIVSVIIAAMFPAFMVLAAIVIAVDKVIR